MVNADHVSPPDLTEFIEKSQDQYVGAGYFSDIYKRKMRSKEVAVKAFRFKLRVGMDKMAQREIGIWRRLNHPNIVPFLGIATGFGIAGSHSLVSLWMPNGTVESLLKEHKNLEVNHRLQLLLDIANGLHYLHSFALPTTSRPCPNPIVHGDLNPGNVLLDHDYTARLIDFGYASVMGEIPESLAYLNRSTNNPGATRWMAPERVSLTPSTHPTTESDIYSFGCIAIQVLSGKQPWSELWDGILVSVQLAQGLTPPRPTSQPIEGQHWEFIASCLCPAPNRPMSSVLVSSLERFLDDCPHPRVSDLGRSASHNADLLTPSNNIVYSGIHTALPTSKNIVLFGETGAGKSSMINLLAGRNVASTSLNLGGRTLQATEYAFITLNPRTLLRIFDTAGLKESDMDLNTFIDAIEKVQKLITSLNEAGGIDLLLFCVKTRKPTIAIQQMYRLFSEILCSNHVPLALVITGLENEPVMEDWWTRNGATFEKCGILSVAHACITAVPARIPLYSEKREQSRKALQKLFHDALSNNKRPYIQDIQDLFVRFITNLRSLVTNRLLFRRRAVARELEAHCGLSPIEAQKLADLIITQG